MESRDCRGRERERERMRARFYCFGSLVAPGYSLSPFSLSPSFLLAAFRSGFSLPLFRYPLSLSLSLCPLPHSFVLLPRFIRPSSPVARLTHRQSRKPASSRPRRRRVVSRVVYRPRLLPPSSAPRAHLRVYLRAGI